MATAESVKDKIQSLIEAANAVTGRSDTNLTSAMLALAAISGKSDLAENDPESPAFVKNRTHFDSREEVEYFSVVIDEDTDLSNPFLQISTEPVALEDTVVEGTITGYDTGDSSAAISLIEKIDASSDYGLPDGSFVQYVYGIEDFTLGLISISQTVSVDDIELPRGVILMMEGITLVSGTALKLRSYKISGELKQLDPKYIKDMYYTEPGKTAERETSITWDGNTSGLVQTTLTTGSGPTHYKVADLPDGWDADVVSNLNALADSIKINGILLSEQEYMTPSESEEYNCWGARCGDIASFSGTVTVVTQADTLAWNAQLSPNGFLNYPEPGIYFSTHITSFECAEAVEIPEVVHRLKPKYIGALNYEKILVEELTPDSDQAPSCTFIVGDSYDVVWNGVVYENIECVDIDGYRCLGGDDYPFYIDDDGGDGFYLEPEDSWETVTVIHKNSLNPIYLPEPLTDSEGNKLATEAFVLANAGGGASAEWELIANYSLAEATQTIESLWTATPMKRIKVELSTPAAAANTSYMPMRVYTGEDLLRAYSFFYPTALPMTAATTMVYDISAQKIGENNVVEIEELKGNMATSNRAFWVEATKKQISVGNSAYGTPNPTDTIFGIYIQTYGSFDVGTTLKIWGTRA